VSKLIVRLLLSIFLIPLAMIVFIVIAVSTEHNFRGSPSPGLLIAGCITWALVALYWIMLWRDTVRWDRKRQLETVLIAIAAGVVAIFLAIMLDQVERQFGDFIASVTAPMLWLVGSVIVWRERPAERIERLQSAGTKVLVCPSCGYNLTGLREVRCPECGMQMTIDQLVAAQPRESSEELTEK
jgi:4-amino-4-deoxy-L-arabinose transferase-like glycosyltransferase